MDKTHNIVCEGCKRTHKEVQIIGFDLEDGTEVRYCLDCLEDMVVEWAKKEGESVGKNNGHTHK